MEKREMEIREWKFEEIVEMAGLFEQGGREILTEGNEGKEVEFGGMGFPSLPQVSCPVRDIRFAKSDGGITGVLSGIGVESTFWNGQQEKARCVRVEEAMRSARRLRLKQGRRVFIVAARRRSNRTRLCGTLASGEIGNALPSEVLINHVYLRGLDGGWMVKAKNSRQET